MDEIGKIENGGYGRNEENRESGKSANGEMWHIEDIARLTGRSVKRIRCMRSACPENLPPAFTLPGSQRLCWLPDQVRAWIREHAAAQGACTAPQKRRRPADRLDARAKMFKLLKTKGVFLTREDF